MLLFSTDLKGKKIQLFLVISIFNLWATLSFAQTYNVPSTSSTGQFTITYSATTTIGLIEEWVSEANEWQTIGGGQKSGSIPVVKTVSGTYTYRMKNCTGTSMGLSCATVPGSQSIVVSLLSSSSSVTSSSSSSSSSATPTFEYEYDDLGRLTKVKDSLNDDRGYFYDAAGNRTFVSVGSFVPGKPTGLFSGLIANCAWRGSWNAVPGATSYVFRHAAGPETTLTATSITYSCSYNNQNYNKPYWVRACVSTQCGEKAYF